MHRPRPGFPFGAFTGWRLATHPARWLFRVFPLELGEVGLPDGPVVVAANHFSHLDPVVVGIVAKRPIRYLAVDELYGNSRIFDRLTLWLGAIPMSRSRVALGALRLAIAELRSGGTVGLFPEGVRVWTWGEVEPKRGAAWLAHRVGVPLVPVAIAGTDQAWGRGASRVSRARIAATVCDPIDPSGYPGRDGPAEMTEEWARRIDTALASMYARWHG